MKKIATMMLSLALVTGIAAEGKKTSFDVGMSTDPFFGYNILAGGAIPVTGMIDWKVYGLFWTDVGAGIGNNPWTEFGTGATFNVLPSLSVSTLVGVLSGNLQSNNGRATLGEALVPNLTVNYNDGMIEGQVYAGYYKTMSTGREIRGAVDDYLHGWVSAGYIIGKNLSAGIHFEHLETLARYAQGSRTALDRGSYQAMIYQWMGGYVEAKFPDNKTALRFTGGIDTVVNREHFYKMSLAMSF
jgi:hypothetical protein